MTKWGPDGTYPYMVDMGNGHRFSCNDADEARYVYSAHNGDVDALQSVIDRILKLLQVDEEDCYCATDDNGNRTICLHHHKLKLAMDIARREGKS